MSDDIQAASSREHASPDGCHQKNEPLKLSQSHDSPSVVEDRRFSNKPPSLHPSIRGRCPSCGFETLFLGSNGYVTCSWLECKNPGAATDLLAEREQSAQSQAADHASAAFRLEMNAKEIAGLRATNEQQAAEIVSLRAELEGVRDSQVRRIMELGPWWSMSARDINKAISDAAEAVKEATQRERDALREALKAYPAELREAETWITHALKENIAAVNVKAITSARKRLSRIARELEAALSPSAPSPKDAGDSAPKEGSNG